MFMPSKKRNVLPYNQTDISSSCGLHLLELCKWQDLAEIESIDGEHPVQVIVCTMNISPYAAHIARFALKAVLVSSEYHACGVVGGEDCDSTVRGSSGVRCCERSVFRMLSGGAMSD
jgi:hypothetical protein